MVFKDQKKLGVEQGIFVNNTRISKTDQAKFLGIIIADNLSWQPHINYISKKISKSIGIMYKLSKYLNKTALISLYYSLIYPYIIYCNEVWGLGYASHRMKLFILQKRAIRLICHASRDAPSNPLFKDLKILKINDINSHLITILMFKLQHNELPLVFNDIFKCNSSVHSHDTRQSLELHIPLVTTNYTQMTVRYVGVILWNIMMRQILYNCIIYTYKKIEELVYY